MPGTAVPYEQLFKNIYSLASELFLISIDLFRQSLHINVAEHHHIIK